MPKRSRKLPADFEKKRRKLGKKPPDAASKTQTEVKARKVFVPTKQQDGDSEEASNPVLLLRGGRRLGLAEILSRCRHSSGKIRAEAAASMRALLQQELKEERETREWAGTAVETALRLLDDGDADVRAGARGFLTLAPRVAEAQIELIAVRVAASICSIHNAVRVDAVLLVPHVATFIVGSAKALTATCNALVTVLRDPTSTSSAARTAMVDASVALSTAARSHGGDSRPLPPLGRLRYYHMSISQAGAPRDNDALRMLQATSVEKFQTWMVEAAAPGEVVSSVLKANTVRRYSDAVLSMIEAFGGESTSPPSTAAAEAEASEQERALFTRFVEGARPLIALPVDKVRAETAELVAKVEDNVAESFCALPAPTEAVLDALREYMQSERPGHGVVSRAKVIVRLAQSGSHLPDTDRVRGEWLEQWAAAPALDSAQEACTKLVQQIFEQPCDGSCAVMVARTVPRLLWKLVRDKSERGPSGSSDCTLQVSALLHRLALLVSADSPAVLRTLWRGLEKLFISGKGPSAAPGLILYLPAAARAELYGAVRLLWDACDQHRVQRQLSFLHTVRPCLRSTKSWEVGVSNELLALVSVLPLSRELLTVLLAVACDVLCMDQKDDTFFWTAGMLSHAGVSAASIHAVVSAATASVQGNHACALERVATLLPETT
mmetsp:Transcript_8742/g.26256  ORF Transcript_8742/g.26256 Transcript_8742/m.26256 type:complete len:667 (+) Transcript_8742:98-2098(+)|eukprot:CAMPEP_0198729370 /NCGR_PEP_ID=MMETSP1475-20131203/17701_1 /TAXON_ID= ORGANISM="Unidentified sp., Strain CCMP1999" /NCGR_SAMPLE_ID=MMETSP1475 /ASSEMBLY_ACC=CAM_ASM_001111 /LENGTH=666 /DNA_ID=CAMNT_0044491995 /DNA_START=91 /DNA_END=2091 /DNA_ORIENTATION=-